VKGIADFQLPIADWSEIANCSKIQFEKLEIGNW
jgi:hypothetical protein